MYTPSLEKGTPDFLSSHPTVIVFLHHWHTGWSNKNCTFHQLPYVCGHCTYGFTEIFRNRPNRRKQATS